MDEKYERVKNLSRLILLDSVEREIWTKVFRTKYLKRKHYKIFVIFTNLRFNIIYMSTIVPSSNWLAKH